MIAACVAGGCIMMALGLMAIWGLVRGGNHRAGILERGVHRPRARDWRKGKTDGDEESDERPSGGQHRCTSGAHHETMHLHVNGFPAGMPSRRPLVRSGEDKLRKREPASVWFGSPLRFAALVFHRKRDLPAALLAEFDEIGDAGDPKALRADREGGHAPHAANARAAAGLSAATCSMWPSAVNLFSSHSRR